MRRQRNLAILAMIAGIISAVALEVWPPTVTLAASNVASIKFGKCTGGHRTACVIDGDTLWIGGTKIRIADIDAPEISDPKCASNLLWATARPIGWSNW
jgi:endonuclease YncB( thermonuclease family)